MLTICSIPASVLCKYIITFGIHSLTSRHLLLVHQLTCCLNLLKHLLVFRKNLCLIVIRRHWILPFLRCVFAKILSKRFLKNLIIIHKFLFYFWHILRSWVACCQLETFCHGVFELFEQRILIERKFNCFVQSSSAKRYLHL